MVRISRSNKNYCRTIIHYPLSFWKNQLFNIAIILHIDFRYVQDIGA